MGTSSLDEKKIVESVSQERLMADTRAIAEHVRLSGTEEESKAFGHVEVVLRELGLQPKMHKSDAYISLPREASFELAGVPVPAITHSMAVSTPEGGLTAPIVDIGAGSAEDFDTADARGKIVLVDGIAIPTKMRAAEQAGALACVFANQDEHVHEMIVSTVWGPPTPDTVGELPTIPALSVGSNEAQTIRRLISENENAEARVRAEVETGWREIPTLVAQLDGVEEPEKFVLFSGHIDSWHYGAMDNGSADALMLEVLRALLEERGSLRRSLRLAFWSGHSHGRYAGSTWYADHHWEDLNENCVLHLNADSPGGRGASVITEGQAMAETKPVAADVIHRLTGEEFNGSRFGRSGDQSFMSIGIPSLFMFVSEQPVGQDESAGDVSELLGGPGARGGGVGWWWHTTEDTVDKIDPEFLARDTRIYAASAYRFLTQSVVPLDVHASAQELLEHIKGWQEKAGARFDLSRVIERAEDVARAASELQDQGSNSMEGGLGVGGTASLNERLRVVERELVRMNYSATDPYTQDPAAGQPAVPALSPIEDLLKTNPGSSEERQLSTLLVRRRNRLLDGLSRAETHARADL